MTLESFTHLADVPVHYARYDAGSGLGYGTRGKRFRPRASPPMIATLDACFADIFSQSPFGPGEVITSAGAYVDKPGWHGAGRAFDLDGIFWSQAQLVAIEFPRGSRDHAATIRDRHLGNGT